MNNCFDGEQWTKDQIEKHNLYDGNGIIHRVHGIMTYQSTDLGFACFDDYPGVGRQLHWMKMPVIKKVVFDLAKIYEPTGGKIGNPNDTINTGYGYLVSPEEGKAKSYSLHEKYLYDTTSKSKDLAVLAFKELLETENMVVEKIEDKERQIKGCDLIFWHKFSFSKWVTYSMEVKSRGCNQNWPKFFIQISETNEKKYR